MAIYLLVEGRRTEPRVYSSWLSAVLPGFTRVYDLADVTSSTFYVFSGHGYPSYLEHVRAGLGDAMEQAVFNEFVVCVDAEEVTAQERAAEVCWVIDDELSNLGGREGFRTHVIVQDCCFETWFLGNRRLSAPQPQTEKVRLLRQFYDVAALDPELMPAQPGFPLRAHFHLAYLKALFVDRRISYTKTKPGEVCKPGFLKRLLERRRDSGHLQSFGNLVDVLVSFRRRYGFEDERSPNEAEADPLGLGV